MSYKNQKLGNLIELGSGLPVNRLRGFGEFDDVDGKYQVYSTRDSDVQYLKTDETLPTVKLGQVVIALVPQTAMPVPESKRPLTLNTNYLSGTLSESLLPEYFAWWFNESEEAQRQKAMSEQGSALVRLSLGTLRDMKMTVPPLKVQQAIGRMYIVSLELAKLYAKRSELRHAMTNAVLNAKLQEGA
ncbi:hypothetical protein [Lacticaseibacillus kribbianus]|uniref:hypothetical protein n=1 Tax=Lacticaseibacillus kribbianus TaxID=2926292 RepID=UPI001CD4A881|nr:hypothetical protein [Lacticaseibacillus kribbianus]